MKYAIAGAMIAATAVGAQAADLPVKAPYVKAPVLAVYNWTGFYIGVNAGYGLGRDRTDLFAPTGPSFERNYVSPGGGFGGGQIGYNWQTGSGILGSGPLVFGVEADFQGAAMRDDRNCVLVCIPAVTTNYDQRLDWFGTVRGRVGIANGPVLTYVTAGGAYAGVRSTVNQAVFGPTASFTDPTRNRGGWVVGSGIEAALGGNWTAKIEYLYMNLGNSSFAFVNGGVPQTLYTDYRENLFRVGLNYRIGGNSMYAPVAAANWTGFYVGGNVGSGIARDRSSIATTSGVTEAFNLAPDGYNGGVQAGYNWQASNWVFGVEADIQASSQRDNKTCVLTCTAGQFAAYDARLPWFGTARGRIGYSVGSTLFYGTGGYAYGQVRTDFTTPFAAVSIRETRGGWTVGGGIETPFDFLGMFGKNWTSKTEYLYVDLGRSTTSLVGLGVGVGPGVGFATATATSVREHIFRTGLNYHFNSPVVARY